MKPFNKDRSVGMVAGVVFVAVIAGLLSTMKSRPASVQGLSTRAQRTAQAPSSHTIADADIAPAVELGRAFTLVASRVKPAVVSVYSEKVVKARSGEQPSPFGGDDFLRQFFGQQFQFRSPQGQPREYGVPQRGMGSGMILDAQGHILTNNHVVKDVDEIKVRTADERQFEAKVVATDPRSDVAVIQIEGDVPSDLPTVELGDSDALKAGSLVLAVGAPFGLTQTVTQGIISATGRSNVGISDFEDFLQTDAAINPGNSGGPLIDMNGRVIGMTSAIATSVGQFGGVGFAIPANMIKEMLPTLTQGKSVTRGMLGVTVQGIDEELAKEFHSSSTKGALVAQVNKGSPADKAGIKAGDVIVRFDGKDVQNTPDLRKRVAATAPGQEVDVELLRDGKKETLHVEIGKLESESNAQGESSSSSGDGTDRFGFGVQTLTPDLAKELGVEAEKGVVVTEVRPGGAASFAGLQPGDVIVEAEHHPVASADELASALSKSKDKVLLRVKRGGGSVFIVMHAH
jgi:serine protease Do